MAQEQPLAEAVKIGAERLLAQAFAGPLRIQDATRIVGGSRAEVYRLYLDTPLPDGATSAILKVVRNTAERPYEPERGTFPAWTLFNEWASLHCLGEVKSVQDVAPRFYAGDRAMGMLLMEDLGEGIRLDHALLSGDPARAEALLLEYAKAHGMLHAAMIGHEATYSSQREALGPPLDDASVAALDWLESTFAAMCASLDVVPSTEALTDVAAVAATIRDPGPFLTLTQGDNCPDNCLLVDGKLRLIDFEGGQYRHALLDGVYGRMLFPTCWCVAGLPEELPGRMERAYRAELARGCPEALDDGIFACAVCAACVFWVLDWCHAVPLARLITQDLEQPESFKQWQLATGRQRIFTRLRIAAETAEELGRFEALGTTFSAMCVKLRTLWPASDRDMTLYPAFR